jgi:hypothetical protein
MRPEKVAESRKGHPITDSRVGLLQIQYRRSEVTNPLPQIPDKDEQLERPEVLRRRRRWRQKYEPG